jgi:hypothetical protein
MPGTARNPPLRALDDMNEVFVADVHRTQRIWTERPELAVPPSQPGRGRPAKKLQASGEPITVENLAKEFGSDDWTRRVLRDGQFPRSQPSQRVSR